MDTSNNCRWPDCNCYHPQGPNECRRIPISSAVPYGERRDLAAEKAEYERMLSRHSQADRDYTVGKLKSD